MEQSLGLWTTSYFEEIFKILAYGKTSSTETHRLSRWKKMYVLNYCLQYCVVLHKVFVFYYSFFNPPLIPGNKKYIDNQCLMYIYSIT